MKNLLVRFMKLERKNYFINFPEHKKTIGACRPEILKIV